MEELPFIWQARHIFAVSYWEPKRWRMSQASWYRVSPKVVLEQHGRKPEVMTKLECMPHTSATEFGIFFVASLRAFRVSTEINEGFDSFAFGKTPCCFYSLRRDFGNDGGTSAGCWMCRIEARKTIDTVWPAQPLDLKRCNAYLLKQTRQRRFWKAARIGCHVRAVPAALASQVLRQDLSLALHCHVILRTAEFSHSCDRPARAS